MLPTFQSIGLKLENTIYSIEGEQKRILKHFHQSHSRTLTFKTKAVAAFIILNEKDNETFDVKYIKEEQ